MRERSSVVEYPSKDDCRRFESYPLFFIERNLKIMNKDEKLNNQETFKVMLLANNIEWENTINTLKYQHSQEIKRLKDEIKILKIRLGE